MNQESARTERLESLLYDCILELEYVQCSFEACGSDMCATSNGKRLIELGMELLNLTDLSGESLKLAKRRPA